MNDKQLEQKLRDVLRGTDPSVLEQVKDMLSGGSGALAEKLDAVKAAKKLREMNLENALSGIDISGVIREIKQNPSILNELKKNL